jgi:hypothetical protein
VLCGSSILCSLSLRIIPCFAVLLTLDIVLPLPLIREIHFPPAYSMLLSGNHFLNLENYQVWKVVSGVTQNLSHLLKLSASEDEDIQHGKNN